VLGRLPKLFVALLCLAAIWWTETKPRSRNSDHGDPQHPRNPNYFEDASGSPLNTGVAAHKRWIRSRIGVSGVVWCKPAGLDTFVSFLKGAWTQFTIALAHRVAEFQQLPGPQRNLNPPDFTVSPHPWMRTGPGIRTDGELKIRSAQSNVKLCPWIEEADERIKVQRLHRPTSYQPSGAVPQFGAATG